MGWSKIKSFVVVLIETYLHKTVADLATQEERCKPTWVFCLLEMNLTVVGGGCMQPARHL
jgi:rRNA pseudouridine-1189 N-methylase Emg1 (Nep1/Mra1 family)